MQSCILVDFTQKTLPYTGQKLRIWGAGIIKTRAIEEGES